MWEEEKAVDVALVCADGGAIVWAHKLVLRARCPYLSVLLVSDVGFGVEERKRSERKAREDEKEAKLSNSAQIEAPTGGSQEESDKLQGSQSNESEKDPSIEQEEDAGAAKLPEDWKDECARIEVPIDSLVCRELVRWMYTDQFDLEAAALAIGESEPMDAAGRFHVAATNLDLHYIRCKCELSDHTPPST